MRRGLGWGTGASLVALLVVLWLRLSGRVGDAVAIPGVFGLFALAAVLTVVQVVLAGRGGRRG